MKAGAGLSHLSCLRFLWTPYCPEKLEDDSVEGDGKTMIGAAGLVGSEGERSSSMLSITGQAAGAGPLAPGQRWSLARKHEVVLRLLRGEPVEAVSRQFGVPVWQLERWQALALAPSTWGGAWRGRLSRVGGGHDIQRQVTLRRLPLSRRGHQPRRVAVLPLSAEPAHGGRDASGPRPRREPRDRAPVGAQIWPG